MVPGTSFLLRTYKTILQKKSFLLRTYKNLIWKNSNNLILQKNSNNLILQKIPTEYENDFQNLDKKTWFYPLKFDVGGNIIHWAFIPLQWGLMDPCLLSFPGYVEYNQEYY
jgi:hypothetical protein